MVAPKTIGKNIINEGASLDNRKQEIQLMVLLKNELRKGEAFDAMQAHGVREINTGQNSSLEF